MLCADNQIVFFAYSVNTPAAAGVATVKPKPSDNPPDTIVGIFRLLSQTLMDLFHQQAIPSRKI